MEARKPFEVPNKVLSSSEEVTAENVCSIGCFWPGGCWCMEQIPSSTSMYFLDTTVSEIQACTIGRYTVMGRWGSVFLQGVQSSDDSEGQSLPCAMGATHLL